MVSSVLINKSLESLTAGLSETDGKPVLDALDFVTATCPDVVVTCGQNGVEFATNVGLILAELNTDAQTRIAGMVTLVAEFKPEAMDQIEPKFG
ncbi:MAG: GTP pyrophosphokinase, partial [Oxalobacter sp.]|nr:GTP pyrophosphokinase [Oxalobacter sp.]